VRTVLWLAGEPNLALLFDTPIDLSAGRLRVRWQVGSRAKALLGRVTDQQAAERILRAWDVPAITAGTADRALSISRRAQVLGGLTHLALAVPLLVAVMTLFTAAFRGDRVARLLDLVM
jgi:hypothetical protein